MRRGSTTRLRLRPSAGTDNTQQRHSWRGTLDWSSDFSVPLFNAIALGIPVGVLAMFLLHFVRFASSDGGKEPTAA